MSYFIERNFFHFAVAGWFFFFISQKTQCTQNIRAEWKRNSQRHSKSLAPIEIKSLNLNNTQQMYVNVHIEYLLFIIITVQTVETFTFSSASSEHNIENLISIFLNHYAYWLNFQTYETCSMNTIFHAHDCIHLSNNSNLNGPH